VLVQPAFESPVSVALWTAQVLAFVAVFVLAYRQNRTDYRDSKGKAISWALALAAGWPITVIAWFVARRRLTTPFSSHSS
jgi:hypothetical protein